MDGGERGRREKGESGVRNGGGCVKNRKKKKGKMGKRRRRAKMGRAGEREIG